MDLYDGRTTSHSTRTTGALSVTDPFCMCVTTTQPKAIHAYLSRKDADSGFLNRWIFATGVRRRDRIAWHAGPPDINSAVEMLKSIHAWSGTPREMFIRDEAMEVWKKRFLGEIVPLQEGGADDSMIGRLDLHIKKIILLLTINQQLDQPTAEIVEQAFSVLPYLISTARLIDKALSYTDQEECQNLILDLIKRHSEKVSGGPTIRQLSQSVGKKFTREQIERALKTLEVLDLIVPHKSQGTRGPQTKRYQLNA